MTDVTFAPAGRLRGHQPRSQVRPADHIDAAARQVLEVLVDLHRHVL
mgnify:CR=1 FL=1